MLVGLTAWMAAPTASSLIKKGQNDLDEKRDMTVDAFQYDT